MGWRSAGLVFALLLTSCGGDDSSLSLSDNPAVAISHVDGPLVGGRAGALVDGVDARKPRTGALLVAAAQQYDPVTGQTTENPISVYVTVSDALGVDSVELLFNDTSMGTFFESDGQAFKNPFIFPAPRSNYPSVPIPGSPSGLVGSQLRALASDTTGQLSEAAVLTVAADGSRPAITFSASGDGPPYTGPVTLTGQATDPETGIRSFSAFLNGAAIEINPATPTSFNVREEGLTAGTQTVRLVAVNGVLVPNEAVFTFEVAEETETPVDPEPPVTPDPPVDPEPPVTPDPPVDPDDNQAPTVSLSATPASGDAPLTVDFSADAQDADGDTLSYLWDFGNGDTALSGTSQSVTYDEAGDYTATVMVMDGNGGQATDEITVTVGGDDDGGGGGGTDNEAPTVTLSASPTEGDAPLTVALTASATDAENDELTYMWDFGNGETALDGSTQSVTYDAAGRYTATVVVTDGNGGTASDEATITVGDGGDDGDVTPPTITSFVASPTSVTSGQASTLSWEIDGTTTEVTISPGVGDVTADEDKQVTVKPTQTTTYTITATNGTAAAASKEVTVTVTGPPNGGVDAVEDTAETASGQPVTIDVLGNDKPSARALTIVAATSPRQGGSVEISRDSKTISYTPPEGFTGEDIFTYTVRDEDGNKASANVSVQVN